MNDKDDKNQPPNFSEDMDIYYQEIEKATFLIESELKDFKELIYLCSSINKKYTALLYCDKEHSYLYLFVLKHIIDKVKENISYKIKAKLVFNKSEIDKTNLDEKQIFMDEQAIKNLKNDYDIRLINRDLILLQVIGKKLIMINFDKKEYAVLFSNINDKKLIHVVDSFDELLLIKKEQNSDSSRKKNFQIRTYVFCIASGVLYFFIINDKIFSELQFLLIPFPFEENIKDCIDFKILKIMNKTKESSDLTNKKFYFVLNVLLNGKLVRYVTDYINISLKEILLKFNDNMKNNLIRKTAYKLDKTNNNFNNSKLKIYRSYKCASYIILQIDFHIYTFIFYESDTPNEMMKRVGIFEENKNNIIEISNSKMNFINSSENLFKITSSNNNKNEDNSEQNSLLNTNNKIIALNFNSINESLSQTKLNSQPKRHSLANINLSQIKSASKINNYQMSTESINNSNLHNSLEQTDSNIILNETKEISKEINFNSSNKNNNNNLPLKHTSSEKGLIIPEIKTKDKGVVYYSLQSLFNLDFNSDKEKTKEKNKNIDNKKQNKRDIYNNAEEFLKNIKYSFTFNSFISFIKNENSVIVCYTPDKSRDVGDIEIIKKSNGILSLSNDNIQIYDVLHYDSLKYSFLLTNNFIYKFRVNPDLLHILNISKHKNNTSNDDSKKDMMIYYKLKSIFRFSRSNRIQFSEKCKLCKKKPDPNNKIICKKCNRAMYCCEEHMIDDYRNIHFFQCEMNICISKLNSDKKFNESLLDFNYLIISFKNILNQIFILIENKKDYINYSMYLKIMLNILEYTNIEGFMNQILAPMRSAFPSDYKQICNKIFIIELWFFCLNLNVLYIDFIIKSEMYVLASKLVNKIKIVDLIENRDIKSPNMFAYFSLANDLSKYKMNENKEKIEQHSKNYFFDLLEIYTNNNKEGNYLYIHEQFFRYYLYSFCSLLKINLFLKEKTGTLKEINPINMERIVSLIPILFEEKLNNEDKNSNINEFQLKLPLILLYYYLSFILVKIDKVSAAINLLRYILEEIKKINDIKDNKNDKNILENKINFDCSLLEAKVYLNIGILITYNGDFNLGIHYLENCYRLCFEKKLSTILSMKVLKLLSLAYINNDKIDTAFILLKTAIKLTSKFLSIKNNFNSNILINKLSLFKLKAYLLFLYQYISYKYQKLNKFLTNKTKGKNNNIINDPDDIPTSIFPISFNKMSPALIGYICEEDKNKKLAEFFKEQINKEDETFKFELDSNLDKFVFFCNNYKFDMIIKALEFLYKLSDKEYEILNNDNGAIQKEEIKEDNNYNNQRERSSSLSRDSSMSYSRITFNKDKLALYFKEDNQNFFDEIEVKMGLYDQLSDLQQKELKSIQNNIFRRSILLRDPKGKIDKFNLNYHPQYTFDFYELFTKMSETIFLNQLEQFGVGENYESKIFEHKNDGLIHRLRKFLNFEKIQNILYMEKVKLIQKYKQNIIFLQKNENRETVTKNQMGVNEYMNKLKEKLGKDNFLKNMNMEGLYEKLLSELTYRELDYILENPSKILNYIYINAKPPFEEQNNDSNIIINNENENSENEEKESNNSDLKKTKINQKIKNFEENKKKNLSPQEIYNNLIDLLSEKRKERSKKKKQTVNFKNMKIANYLNPSSNTENKNNNLSKKNNNESSNKKPVLLRSITLNKIKLASFQNKKNKNISSYQQNKNKKLLSSSDNKYSFKSHRIGEGNIKIYDNSKSKKSKSFKDNSSFNINEKAFNDIPQQKISNFQEGIEKVQENTENNINTFQDINNTNKLSKKSNVTKKRYQRDKPSKKEILYFEENISQQNKPEIKKEQVKKNINKNINKKRRWTKIFDDKNAYESNVSLIKVQYDNDNKGLKNNNEYLKKTIEKTFDKYKNKSRSMEKYNKINEENKKEFDGEESNKKEKKFVERKKPTFKELREKVLHKNNNTSVSTFY